MKKMTSRLWERIRLSRAVRQKCQKLKKNGLQGIGEKEVWEYLYDQNWQGARTLKSKRKKIQSLSGMEVIDNQRKKAITTSSDDFDWNDLDDLL